MLMMTTSQKVFHFLFKLKLERILTNSSDAVKDADEKADDPEPKKRIHSSTNAAKKARVV